MSVGIIRLVLISNHYSSHNSNRNINLAERRKVGVVLKKKKKHAKFVRPKVGDLISLMMQPQGLVMGMVVAKKMGTGSQHADVLLSNGEVIVDVYVGEWRKNMEIIA